MTFQHETNLAPITPFDRLQPLTRQFTGAARIHRAYVLNRTTGKIIEACGHKHRTPGAATECANRMLGNWLKTVGKSAHNTAHHEGE